jgi:hypothetical protein
VRKSCANIFQLADVLLDLEEKKINFDEEMMRDYSSTFDPDKTFFCEMNKMADVLH